MAKQGLSDELYRIIDEKLDRILEQTTRHNGRMIALEKWQEEDAKPILENYVENRAQVRGAVKLWTIIGVCVLVTAGYFWNIYITNLKSQLAEDVSIKVVATLKNDSSLWVK